MESIKLVLASRNKHKITEISAMLSEYLDNVQLLSLDDVGIHGDVEENGKSFEENALLKARFAGGIQQRAQYNPHHHPEGGKGPHQH